ncbi:Acyl-CoA dehydrogenase [Purpureocillium lavendulum]|uniref:Acyl-CoA dehydrogenase n=1 Tax=Purpureocillium lavendulum TaxID=1247861 RepID=A0AB34FJZ6_9HYPO|nr:Acyl-CoA dehydrogenase [Purpureocillium lavendulum]
MSRSRGGENVDSDRPEQAPQAPLSFVLSQQDAKHDGDETVFEAIDPVEERKLVRKLDMVIVPTMALIYFLQCKCPAPPRSNIKAIRHCVPYLDKSSINYAAVFGLRNDLSLTGEQFSWVVSLFYFGQLCSEYPAAYVLSRFRITTCVGVTIIAWGIVEMTIGATTNFQGIAAARFFLGFTEAAVSPAFIILISLWYRRREHPIRVAAWVSMNGISQIVGALLMYAVGGVDNMAIASWRAIFLIFGGLPIACGIAFLFLMPKDTTTAWFLNARERDLATRRLAIDRASRERSEFNKAQMWEALISPLTWMYFWFALLITLPSPILKFSSIVINGFGYSNFRTMLLGTPSGAISFATVWISALGPRIFPNTRIYTIIFLSLIPLAGSLVLLLVPADAKSGNAWAIVAATWLAGCSSAPLSGVAALMASNVKGNTKKSVVSAGFFISYCVGCIVSPQAWTESDAPRYTKGCILSIVSWIALIISLVIYLLIVTSINKKRDADAGHVHPGHNLETERAGIQTGLSLDSDLTDTQDKGFRYSI